MSYLLAVTSVVLLIATIATLFRGLLSMGIGGDLDDQNSTRLMFTRVGLQGLAIGILLLALFAMQH